MSEDCGPPNKRVKIERDDIEKLSKEELMERWYERETFIDALLSTKRTTSESNDELIGLRESEEKLKQQQMEASRRENVLVMRLTAKEQEMQDLLNQITELKQAHSPNMVQLRNMLLDPAVNLMFQRMKKEMDGCKDKLEQAQNDLAAWKFTPDSQTGKRLMAKCRMLLSENEELGKVISSGRTAKLEGEIALEKKFVEEMKTSQAETDEFLVDMDEDLEGMQSTIYLLQQQLKEAKETICQLQEENEHLCKQVSQEDGARTFRETGGEAEVMDSEPSKPWAKTNFCVSGQAQPAHEISSVGSTLDSNLPGCDSRTNSHVVENRSHNHNSNLHNEPQTKTAQSTTTNGDHHILETDTSDGLPESCDESMLGHNQHNQDKRSSKIHNHVSLRISQSSDGAYTAEGTDLSSDDWSPVQPETLISDGVSATEHQSGVVSEMLRTEGKLVGSSALYNEVDSLQNGLVNAQYDSQGDDYDT